MHRGKLQAISLYSLHSVWPERGPQLLQEADGNPGTAAARLKALLQTLQQQAAAPQDSKLGHQDSHKEKSAAGNSQVRMTASSAAVQ